MKNNIFYTFIVIFFFFSLNLFSEELEINSDKIQYDDVSKISIFEGNVNIKDEKGNKLFSEYSEYDKLKQLVKTAGETKIITSGGYEVSSSNVIFDHANKIIRSDYKTQIVDKDGNKVFVDMFNYSVLTNIFFSKGTIKVFDINNNNYNFSEIYIDENKKKIVGSDIKAFLKQKDILIKSDNEPRFFANSMSLSSNVSTFDKGIFTYCKNRGADKCPPWTLRSKKIKHDLAKKTIYYENVVLKIYNFPIFFSPRFSHADPTVERRSGLLAPAISNSTTLGSGFSTPYYWNIAKDKDLTLTPKLYVREKPLLLAEYRQDFRNSFLIVDGGYTQGYKKKTNIKTSGGRAHFFSKFNMNFLYDDEKSSDLEINIQKTSNDTYLKVYDINSELVDKDQDVLENTINFNYQNKDFYFGLTPSVFEDMTKQGNSRNEYLFPMAIEKNIMASEKYGFIDLESNVRLRNYETDKQTNFLVNNFNWKSNNWLGKFGFENYFEGKIKAVNYDANNTKEYKNENNNTELHSVLGYFTKLGLYKKDFTNNNFHTLTPKFLLRYAPGHMRDVESGKLNIGNLFNINKVNKFDVIESGLSASLGFEYKKNELNKENDIGSQIFSFSAGQVISEKENMDIPSSTSLDQKFSDIVGETKYNVNDRLNLNYNFSVDQNYKTFNYNEISSTFNVDVAKFNVKYLQERNHIGNQEFIQSGIDFKINDFTELNVASKRNLLTNSAEFYNLSYNYFNDCLKAGIAYRREFYTDRDIEPANNLMFTISIKPFAQINTPVN